MNFFSIKEFFYKLNTIGFILLLLPLVAFVYLYFRAASSQPAIVDAAESQLLLIVLILILVCDLTIVHLLWRARLNSAKSFQELAKKMDRYFMLVVMRNGAYAIGSLLMAFGYFLTESDYFTGTFLVIMILVVFQWPRAVTFCDHLDLRGSDREMVLDNRDLTQRKVRK